MNLLKRIFGGGSADEEPVATECRHLQLAPRWDDADAMGDLSRASAYRCAACGAEFTPEQAKELAPSE